VHSVPFHENDQYNILTLYNHIGRMDNKPVLKVYDFQGNLIRSKALLDSSKISRYLIAEKYPDSIYHYFMIEADGDVYSIDQQLNVGLIATLNTDQAIPLLIDLDADGINEKVFSSTDASNFLITRQDFGSPVSFELTSTASVPNCFSLKDKHNENRLSIYKKDMNTPFSVMRQTHFIRCVIWSMWVFIWASSCWSGLS